MQFDAVLLLSFGGPEGPEQVRPFLENVTRGRGVPAERLDAVAEHYLHFGGVSPINGINRTLIAELEAQQELPVYFGNRNWEPYVEDAVTAMRDNGVRRAAVFATSAWSGYSSCTQYVEDIARARRAAGRDAPELVKLRPYFDHPLFVEMFADAITAAAATVRGDARLVFTAHSIPTAADRRCGPNLTAAKSPTPQGWSRPLPDTATLTWPGSRDRARRRCPGWSQTLPTSSPVWLGPASTR
ncbi:ferrochelatase [Mycobacterium tuberculosis]|nr:ferrochelatase [Mycobacterium tuberculosis]